MYLCCYVLLDSLGVPGSVWGSSSLCAVMTNSSHFCIPVFQNNGDVPLPTWPPSSPQIPGTSCVEMDLHVLAQVHTEVFSIPSAPSHCPLGPTCVCVSLCVYV